MGSSDPAVQKLSWRRAALVAASTAAYVLLLVRWFVAPDAAGAARTAPVWPFALLFAVLAAVTGWAHRETLAGMRRELALALRLPRRQRLALASLLAVSLAAQLPTMLFPAGLLHSDAAINGLMGLHIAEGRVAPAFYYGQEFMGTLFSHVLALVFVVAGPFVGATAVVTWLFWAGFLLGTFYLVRQASTAVVAFAVALWLAIPPSLLLITLAQSEYAQFFLLSVWALALVAARTAGPLAAPAWWVVAGVLLGLAFWSHPMAAMVIVAAAGSIIWLLPGRAAAAALWRLGLGIFAGLLPAFVGWGARLGRFLEWFLQGGGRGGAESLLGAASGMARSSLGNLLFGTEGRATLPASVGVPVLLLVLGSAAWALASGRGARRPVGEDGAAADPGRRARAAAVVPLGAFVLLQLGVLLARRYEVVPTQYIVPLYLGLPALVAVAAWAALRRRSRRAATLTAACVLLWACVPLPRTIAWLRALPANQATMNASIAALHAAGIDACIGPYWDAYRLSYLTLEQIVCESIDVRRVPGYRERVAQRVDGAPPFVAAPQRRAALAAHRQSLNDRGIPWVYVRTTRFEALLPRRR